MLLLVLVALVPFVGTSGSFSSDEGAYVFEARSVARDHSWTVAHPFPEADPNDEAFPLALALHSDKGWIAVDEHPARVLMLAGADRLGGATAMVLLAVLGTWVAALVAAALARRLDPGLAPWALWSVGVGTPLLFNGYLVLGHTEGAALCGLAVWFTLRYGDHHRLVDLAVAAAAVAGAILMRSEAVLFVAALALVLFAVKVGGSRRSSALAGGVVLVTGGVVALGESRWAASITGPHAVQKTLGSFAPRTLTGRWSGFVTTWLKPGYRMDKAWYLALVAAVVLLVVGVVLARVRPGETPMLVGLGIGVLVLAGLVGVLAIGPYTDYVVPGLLMACPVVVAGLCAVRLPEGEARVMLGVAGVFAAAVLATQYDRGGTLEWGGRYFVLGLPVAVPVLLVALRDLGRRVPIPSRRVGLAAIVALTLGLNVAGLFAIRNNREFLGRVLAAADRAGAKSDPGGTGDPVFVTSDSDIGRFTWPASDHQRWLWVPADQTDAVVDALAGLGVKSFVVATQDPSDEPGLLGPDFEGKPDDRAGSWKFYVTETP